MDYPKYKYKRRKPIGRFILMLVLLNFVLSYFFPWYTYVHGSLLCLIISQYVIRKHRGFRAVVGILAAVMVMLLIFDFIDYEFTWSLDFAFPSFLIFVTVWLFLMILVKKKSWKKHYDLHVYAMLLNVLMVLLLLFGVIESSVLVIVTYSILMVTVMVIRLRVGSSYRKNIEKFTHH